MADGIIDGLLGVAWGGPPRTGARCGWPSGATWPPCLLQLLGLGPCGLLVLGLGCWSWATPPAYRVLLLTVEVRRAQEVGQDSVGDLGKEVTSQQVAHEGFEVCSENIYVTTVRSGHMTVN